MRISDWSSDVCSSDLIACLSLASDTKSTFPTGTMPLKHDYDIYANREIILSLAFDQFQLLSDAMVSEESTWRSGESGRWFWSCADAFSVPASALRLPAFAGAAERSAARGIGSASCRERVCQ